MSLNADRDFLTWTRRIQEETETCLREVLPAATLVPQRLHEAMRYAVLDGGKRVRPLLVHAAGYITGAPLSRLHMAAAAVEVMHC